MYLNKKAVRAFVNGNGKQISPDAILELDCRVINILKNSIALSHSFKRITKTEIQYSRG